MRKLAGLWAMCGLAVLPVIASGQTPPVTVSQPWMRYLLPSIPAGGYMVLKNNGTADLVLTGASSPACGVLMLHKSEDNSGMSMMMDVQDVTVPAHGSVTFTSGSYHLMCMQPKMTVGAEIPVSLVFKDGSELNLTMQVYGPTDHP